MNNEEIWKPIEGYEGLYEVSNYGVVKSLPRVKMRKSGKPLPIKERIMKLNKNKRHFTVSLTKESDTKPNLVHRLVASAFIPIPEKYKDIPIEDLLVHHIDNDPSNNKVNNLMWLTRGEHQKIHMKGENNPNYGKHHTEEAKRKMSEAHKGKTLSEEAKMKISEANKGKAKLEEHRKILSELRRKPVCQYTKEGRLIKIWKSAKVATEETKVCRSSICNCCKGKLKTAGGYIWRYANEKLLA